jgi:hypothetical protein
LQVQKVVGEDLISRNRGVFEECNLYDELLDDVRTRNVEAAQRSQNIRSSAQFSLVEQEVTLWIERLRDAVTHASDVSTRTQPDERDLHLKSEASQKAMAYVRGQSLLVRTCRHQHGILSSALPVESQLSH